MYGKLFATMYDGTLGTRGPWEALVTFQQLIILADQEGIVDMTPEALARRTTIPLDIITKGLEMLGLPDPDSRSPNEEGRRIMRLSDTRSWGWRIVNYAHYRAIRNAEERRAYMRKYQRERRARKAVNIVNPVSTKSTNSSKQKQEAKITPLSGGNAPDDARKVEDGTAKKRQQARASAVRAIEYLNTKAGTEYRLVEANLKLPAARLLQDGASEADLLAVVDLKTAEAARGEFDRKYLRPATLWNAEKFSQYVGQVNARAPTSMRARVGLLAADSSLMRELDEQPAGDMEAIALKAAKDYASVIATLSPRYVAVIQGSERRQFSVEELRAR